MSQYFQYQNLDADGTIFFARELEKIKDRTYDVRYPEYKAIRFIPVSTDAGSGAKSITYRQYDTVGLMKVIASYADDLPRSDVSGQEFTTPVRSLGGSFGYNVQEVRSAQMAGGQALDQRKANAVRRAYDQKVNDIGWFARSGDGVNGGLQGLIYNPNITIASAPNGAAGTPQFSTKTPDEIIEDITGVISAMIELTLGTEIPDTVLLPVAQYNLLKRTPRSATTDTSILKWLMDNNPEITTWDWLNELNAVTPKPSDLTDTTGSDCMLVYRQSSDKLTLEIPQPLEFFPAQERGLEFVIPAHSRIGGVIVYYPLSVYILEDI